MTTQTSSKEGDLSTLSLKLRKLKNKVSTAQAIVSSMGGTSVNHGRLLSVNRELEVYRKNLQDIEEELYLLRLPEEHALFEMHKEIDSLRFECCQQCEELSSSIQGRISNKTVPANYASWKSHPSTTT